MIPTSYPGLGCLQGIQFDQCNLLDNIFGLPRKVISSGSFDHFLYRWMLTIICKFEDILRNEAVVFKPYISFHPHINWRMVRGSHKKLLNISLVSLLISNVHLSQMETKYRATSGGGRRFIKFWEIGRIWKLLADSAS